MNKGMSLQDLAIQLDGQRTEKRDYVAPSAMLHMEPSHAAIDVEGVGTFQPNDVAHGQLASRLKVPKPYYDRMRVEAPALLADNVNHWLDADPQRKRLVRTLGDTARAVVSDSYRPLDHCDLLEAVLPTLGRLDAQVVSSQVTDTRLYIQARTERLRGEVRVGDEVQAGLIISNSEVGCGALRVEHLIYRLVCLNGMVTGQAMRKAHVGRAHGGGADSENVTALLTSEARAADDRAFFLKVRDVVGHVLSADSFQTTLARLRASAEGVELGSGGDPAPGVERIAERLSLTQAERGEMLGHLIRGGDLTQWGTANAVTALAHTAEYDRSVELERAGAAVIELDRSQWTSVAAAA